MKFKPGDIVKILFSVNNIDAEIRYAIILREKHLSHYDIMIQREQAVHNNVNSIYLYPHDYDGYMTLYDPEIPF